MVIKGKTCASYVCYFWMFLCVAGFLAMFLPVIGLLGPSILSPEQFEKVVSKDEQESFRVTCIFLLAYFLAVTVLRVVGTWKLWQSLKVCETNAYEALRCVDVWLAVEGFIIALSYICLKLLDCILLSLVALMFIFCVANFRNGVRNEIHRPGQLLLLADGVPVTASLNGYGPPLPVPSNNGMYPPPPTMTTVQQNESVAPQMP